MGRTCFEQWNFGDDFRYVGVVLLGARLYHPETGRFLQRDPVLISNGGSVSNPYAFAFSDPVNFTDPEGTYPGAQHWISNTWGSFASLHFEWGLSLLAAGYFSSDMNGLMSNGMGAGLSSGGAASGQAYLYSKIPASFRSSLWSDVKGGAGGAADIAVGVAEGVADVPYGLYQTVRHPVRTVKGIGGGIGTAGVFRTL